MYYAYIRDWLQIFPRDQILAIRFEDYIKDRVHVLNVIYSFLGLRKCPLSYYIMGCVSTFWDWHTISGSTSTAEWNKVPTDKFLALRNLKKEGLFWEF